MRESDDLAAILAEIRADLADIKSLANAVATHGEDITLVKKDVAGIMDRIAQIDELLSDYPERLARLETKQKSDDQARQDADAATRAGAGTARDPEHRGMARDEARPLVEASEARADVKIGSLTDLLKEIVGSVREVQGTTLVVLTVGALLGAVFLFIAVRALGF